MRSTLVLSALLLGTSLFAQPVTVTIASTPAGRAFNVTGTGCNGGNYIAPQALTWTIGATCTVSFLSPHSTQIDTQYLFTGWQDGATANPHTIAAPAQPATYTATFKTQFFLTVVANPFQQGAVSGGGWYDSGSTATLTATAASGYRLIGWTPSNIATGPSTATVVVTSPLTVTARFAPALKAPPTNYSVTQIVAASKPFAINNYGQVAGSAASSSGTGTSAFLWTPASPNATIGSVTNLGTLPNSSSTQYSAVAINDRGQVVGNSEGIAFLWSPTTPNGTSGSMAGFLEDPTHTNYAVAINLSGQIVAYTVAVVGGPNVYSYFLWNPSTPNGASGTATPLAYEALGINDFGQLIGGGRLFTPSVPNGSSGTYAEVAGRAINNRGAVVDAVCNLWTPDSPNGATGTTTPFAQPPGYSCVFPSAINSSNQVVGNLGINFGGVLPFLYTGGTVYDLSQLPNWPSKEACTLPSCFTIPVDINDRGQIVVAMSETCCQGTYLLTPQLPPMPTQVSPSSGTGASQIITATYTDSKGWQDLGIVNLLVNNFIDGRGACYLAYSVPLSTLYLVDDAGNAGGPFAGAVVLGNSTAIQNSQCSVTLASATGSGNTLALTLNVTFKAAFGGNRIFYTAAQDAAQNSSGWLPLGVWQVPGSSPATTTAVVGMSPLGGSGLGPTAFTFNFSDTKGYQDLGVVNILIGSALDGRHACYLAYSRPINAIYLVDDNGATLPGKVITAAGSLSNSQCTVSWGTSAVTGSGNNLGLTLNIAFHVGFGPNLVFYLAARDGPGNNNTGWQPIAAWSAQ